MRVGLALLGISTYVLRVAFLSSLYVVTSTKEKRLGERAYIFTRENDMKGANGKRNSKSIVRTEETLLK